MSTSLIMTVLGTDRPGLVRSLADTVAEHGGNWLESRMARLAGQFAGIIRVECPDDSADALIKQLSEPGIPGLTIQSVRESATAPAQRRLIEVDVFGSDRPGIVRELTAAIVTAGGNVEELTTGLESAPMAGHPMFRAHGTISIPLDSDSDSVVNSIESLGDDLTVDVSI
ncbi:MAG: glycine cleavage system protein R [Verrucomicrobiales bacterium]|nr:ACT domain-containing protein [Verrucomicrobiota bacterium JB025]